MRVRLLFTKTGPLRFVGHLDLMRFLQKAFRRSGLSPAYSRGFHPHILLAFAAPLGIGLTGEGEIMDVELAVQDPCPLNSQETERYLTIGLDNQTLPKAPSSSEICARLQSVLPDDIKILAAVRMPPLAPKAMARLYAADYRIEVEVPALPSDLSAKFMQFLAKDVILLVKDEKEKNIRPMIHDASLHARADGFDIQCQIAQGSSENLRPEQLLSAFAEFCGIDLATADVRMIRKTLYGRDMRALIDDGEEILS